MAYAAGAAEERSTPEASSGAAALWGTDGTVTAVAACGETLFIAGSFGTVGPPSGGGVPLDTHGTSPQLRDRIVGEVGSAVADRHGGWYIGGRFTVADDKHVRNVAHVLPSGEIDQWSPAPNGPVSALHLAGDVLYVGGAFEEIAGKPRRNLAALDVRHGRLLPWDPSPDNWVYAIVSGGSRVFVAGEFASIGGAAQRHLAALSPQTGKAVAGWSASPDGSVSTLALSKGTLYLGGGFRLISDVSRYNLAAVDAETGSVLQWNPQPQGASDPYFSPPLVATLAIADERLYVAGGFTSIGGQARSGVAAFDLVSGQVLDWQVYLAVPTGTPYINTVRSNGVDVFLGGYFTSVNGEHRSYAAAVAVLSAEVQTWNPRPNHLPYIIEPSGSDTYMGGSFSSIGKWEHRSHMAALDSRTGELLSWDARIEGYDVRSLLVEGSTIYVGGDFWRVGGSERGGIAALDLATAQANAWNPHPDGPIWMMAVQHNRLFVGGDFTQIGDVARMGAAAFDLTTGALAPWNPRASWGIRSILPAGDRVYVGGFFREVGGAARRYLAAVDTIGGTALPWNPDPDGYVNAIAVTDDGVIVGGWFRAMGGVARMGVAAVDAATGEPLPWDGEVAGGRGAVYSVVARNGRIYIGGNFAAAGGEARRNLASLAGPTGRVTKWQPDPDAPVWALSIERDVLYVGGAFAVIDGRASPSIAGFGVRGASVPKARWAEVAAQPHLPAVMLSVLHREPDRAIVRYAVDRPVAVTVAIYDVQGRKIETVIDRLDVQAGDHEAVLETRHLAAGWYLCRLSCPSGAVAQKLIVVR